MYSSNKHAVFIALALLFVFAASFYGIKDDYFEALKNKEAADLAEQVILKKTQNAFISKLKESNDPILLDYANAWTIKYKVPTVESNEVLERFVGLTLSDSANVKQIEGQMGIEKNASNTQR